MPSTVLQGLLISAIPVGAAFIGAVAAALRPPGPMVRSGIQHFAAGVIFSVVAVELLPEVRRVHDPFEVGWTFAWPISGLGSWPQSGQRPKAERPTGSDRPQAAGDDSLNERLLDPTLGRSPLRP